MERELASQQPRLLRPLGALERWFYLMNQHRQNHFVITANLSGYVDAGRLEAALQQVAARHPLLCASIHPGPNGVPAFYSSSNVRVPLQVFPRSSPTEWMERLENELARGIEPGKPPLFRAVLLVADEGCDLLLSLSHAIGDGKSLLYILRDILLAMSGEVLVPTGLSPSREDLLTQRMGLPSSKVINGEAPQISELPPEQSGPVHETSASVDALLLPASTTQILIRRTHVEQTSVHAALLTALAEAALESDAGQEGAIRMFSPIDIRAALGLADHCTLALSASIQSFSKQIGFWEKARSVKRQLEIDRSLESTLRLAHVFEEILSPNPSAVDVAELSGKMFGYEMMLSNLGEVPFQVKIGNLTIEAIWGPAVQLGFAGEQTIGVATTQGQLTLLHTSSSPILGLLLRCEEILKCALR